MTVYAVLARKQEGEMYIAQVLQTKQEGENYMKKTMSDDGTEYQLTEMYLHIA